MTMTTERRGDGEFGYSPTENRGHSPTKSDERPPPPVNAAPTSETPDTKPESSSSYDGPLLKSAHQTPNGGPLAGATSGSAEDAESIAALAPAPAAPALHGVTAPSGAAKDRPDPDNPPRVGAPHASPAAPDEWDRAIDLAANVGRLSAVLELMLDQLLNTDDVTDQLMDLARDAITKAREATT